MKNYYHILEYGKSHYDIFYRNFYDNEMEAKKELERLKSFFPNIDFEVFVSDTKKKPVIVTM